jgi:hypothetical protein
MQTTVTYPVIHQQNPKGEVLNEVNDIHGECHDVNVSVDGHSSKGVVTTGHGS